MITNRSPVLFILLLLSSLNVHAQAVFNEVEDLLAAKTVTYGQAARLILDASEALTTQNQQEAFDFAKEKNWLPQNVSISDTVRMDGAAFIFVNAFDLSRGLFLRITKSPHYAYRELVYINLIQGRTTPNMAVSGEQLLFITGRLLANVELAAAREAAKGRKQAGESAVETAARREALATEINAMLTEQKVADTVAEVTDAGVMITLSNIQFRADSAELQESEFRKLVEIANILRSIQGIKIQVTGHSARSGTVESQMQISHDRAKSIADYLVLMKACNEADISAVGLGASRPVSDNTSDAGMAANRRVEITILENR